MEHSKQDTVISEWVGQDGKKWRTLSVWVGNGFRKFLQREISPGVWG